MSKRPGFSKASSQDPCYMENASIDDQVGHYETPTPHLGDLNKRAGEKGAIPDPRFTNADPKSTRGGGNGE